MARAPSVRIKRPKAKAVSLFPRSIPASSKNYTKLSLQDDPVKFGNVGFDLTMPSPTITKRAAGRVK